MDTQINVIKRIRLSKAVLADIPREEVELFLSLGHLHNELALLQKLLLWSFRNEAIEPDMQGQLTQSMMLLRCLGARLFEGWQTLRKDFFGAKISKYYEPDLAGIALKAYESVKSYNSAPNPLKALRDGFVFHSSGRDIGLGLQHLSDDPLDIYLGPFGTDSLFYASELVLNVSLLGTAEATALKERLNNLVGAIVSQAGDWLLLIQGIVSIFLSRHPSLQEREVEEFALREPTRFDTITIPWFTSPPMY